MVKRDVTEEEKERMKREIEETLKRQASQQGSIQLTQAELERIHEEAEREAEQQKKRLEEERKRAQEEAKEKARLLQVCGMG